LPDIPPGFGVRRSAFQHDTDHRRTLDPSIKASITAPITSASAFTRFALILGTLVALVDEKHPMGQLNDVLEWRAVLSCITVMTHGDFGTTDD
jgi:hypothetical protein